MVFSYLSDRLSGITQGRLWDLGHLPAVDYCSWDTTGVALFSIGGINKCIAVGIPDCVRVTGCERLPANPASPFHR